MKKVDLFNVILSALIPIVGIILFLAKKDDEPEAARTYLSAGIFSIILSVIISISL